jgi:hypothetical protein
MPRFGEEVDRHVSSGEHLRKRIIAFVDSCPVDEQGVVRFPEATNSTRKELITDLYGWFSAAHHLTQGVLNYDRLQETLSFYLTELAGALNGKPQLKDNLTNSVKGTVDSAVQLLNGLPSDRILIVDDTLRHITLTVHPNTAFILMWMDKNHPELDDVANVFKEVFGQFGIHADTTDRIEPQDVITQVILDRIRSSEFLIADLTSERPNVYYEIGYAYAIGKRPILFRKAGTPVHFDLSVHSVPQYRNITELREMLQKRLEAITGRELPK